MKNDESETIFRNLEKDSLLLDILIDCEEYDEFNNKVKKLNGLNGKINIGLVEETFNEEIIRGKIKEIESMVPNNYHDFDDYFKIILSSKYVRRLLKEKDKEFERRISKDIYKTLTEALLKKIPPKSDDKSEGKNRQNQLRIIFLNEISAASESNLAIGYAEMSLDELGELDEKWNLRKTEEVIKHPYELYALYNKGLTLLHDHTNIEAAIDTFKQIRSQFAPFTEFEDRYKLEEDFYTVFFWLIYIPTMYQLAEASNDLYSSSDLESTIKEALKRIDNEGERVSLGRHDLLTENIANYHKVKFNTQFIFSLIDSGRLDDIISSTDKCRWSQLFKKYFGDEKDFNDFIANCEDKCQSNTSIETQMDAARALFCLEYARKQKEGSSNFLSTSFLICFPHIKTDRGSDWSDFAITFLEGIIFALENHEDSSKPWLENLETPGMPDRQEIENCYRNIFNRINEEEWIARKEDLVDKFMICQEKHLGQYAAYYRKRNPNPKEDKDLQIRRDKLLRYQIELIKNIHGKESERRFKKKWPECEKEKLTKNLIMTLKKFDYEDISAWWKKASNGLSSEIDSKHGFEVIVKNMKDTLSDGRYMLPENDALTSVATFIDTYMNSDFYTKKLRLNAEEFYDHLIYKSCRPALKDSYALTVLRRWQSFTPALSMGSEVGHKGGGYFVFKTDSKGEINEGLVIDPGFDFLENFFDEGFSIKDIDAILMTHSHRDHSSDFMSIVTLVHEMNKRGKRVFENKWRDKKLVLFMTEGCYQNFAEQIKRNRESFYEIVRVEKGKPYPGERKNYFLNSFKLEVQKANHSDLTDHDSVGYIIKDKSKPPRDLIGFTGDTQWFNGIEDMYKDCPIICMNIGGVVDIFKEDKIKLSDLCNKDDEEYINNIKKILLRENHLYLPGFYLMARRLLNIKKRTKTTLLIISELCEEMKRGLRTDLADKLSKGLYVPVLPEDIGLTVILGNNKRDDKVGHVFCKICQNVRSPEDIVAVETEKDNAIVFLCKDHYKKLKEGYSIPKINELELDLNELRKPLDPENRP